MFRKLVRGWIAAAFIAGPTWAFASDEAPVATRPTTTATAEAPSAGQNSPAAPRAANSQPGANGANAANNSPSQNSRGAGRAAGNDSRGAAPADGATSLTRTLKTLAPARDPPRTFQVLPKNARQLRVEGVVLQERDFSCGAAALATVLQYQWGGKESEADILMTLLRNMTQEEIRDRVQNGLSLTDLRRAAAAFGYQTVIGRLPLDKLGESKIPLIVGITVRGYDHFCVVRGVDDEFIYLADPAIGRHRILLEDFERQWQRNAVLVVLRPGADVDVSSPFMATDEERSLGTVNRRFLQSQVVPRAYR